MIEARATNILFSVTFEQQRNFQQFIQIAHDIYDYLYVVGFRDTSFTGVEGGKRWWRSKKYCF